MRGPCHFYPLLLSRSTDVCFVVSVAAAATTPDSGGSVGVEEGGESSSPPEAMDAVAVSKPATTPDSKGKQSLGKKKGDTVTTSSGKSYRTNAKPKEATATEESPSPKAMNVAVDKPATAPDTGESVEIKREAKDGDAASKPEQKKKGKSTPIHSPSPCLPHWLTL